MTTRHALYRSGTLALVLLAAGCSPSGNVADESSPAEEEMAAAPTNRVEIPTAVRRNLGITFAAVEARRVEPTLRVPGRFEYLPTARHEHRTVLPGRVELLVEQFDVVEPGTPLFVIDAPSWRELQQEIAEAGSAIERHASRLGSFEPLRAAHREHERQLERAIEVRRERVERLEEVAATAGGRAAELAEARSALAGIEAQLAETLEKEAELDADERAAHTELDAARSRRDFLLDAASSRLRMTVDKLVRERSTERGLMPAWRTIDRITVRAETAGVVESIGVTNGAWADERTSVMSIVQPDRLRFHGVGLQSDLGRLRDGLPCRIVAPAPTRRKGSIDLQDTMAGTLRLGLEGDPEDRTVDLYVTPESITDWARPGVSAQLEIVVDPAAQPSLAVPLAAIQRDGITPVLFRRDPSAPNRAIRLEADLGANDGRWVAVLSGLRLGDEVVLDGSFQLMLATQSSGGMPKGGHFHADGTFHAEEH